MKLTTEQSVLGQTVRMTVEIEGNGEVRGEALSRIQTVMFRETQRFAEVAGVDVRDQVIERREAERLRTVDKNRPAVILAAGTKDPENGAQILRGEYMVGGKRQVAKTNQQQKEKR